MAIIGVSVSSVNRRTPTDEVSRGRVRNLVRHHQEADNAGCHSLPEQWFPMSLKEIRSSQFEAVFTIAEEFGEQKALGGLQSCSFNRVLQRD
jgi:hypothetical protein